LCYATNDNQTAVSNLLKYPAHFAIVIGGRKSSNSSHLVELCEEKLPTYFIQSEEDILSDSTMKCFNWRTHEEYFAENYFPKQEKPIIAITSGASCPDAIVENVISKLVSYFPNSKPVDEIVKSWH
jgi:4-hydroxy-3-methylbut-2-enyl diphosphate reductase